MMAKEIMEIRMSVGIMYSTRRAMYLAISYLLPPSPTLLTGDEVLLRVGGTRLRYRAASYMSGTLWKLFFTMP